MKVVFQIEEHPEEQEIQFATMEEHLGIEKITISANLGLTLTLWRSNISGEAPTAKSKKNIAIVYALLS